MAENKPEDERQGDQPEQAQDDEPTITSEDELRRLIMEGSDEEIQRKDALLNVLSKAYGIQEYGREAERRLAEYQSDRAVTARTEGLKLRFEAYKNVTVLDSGALVAFAVITRNLVPKPDHVDLLYFAYSAVLVSLATALTMMFVLSTDMANSGPPEPEKWSYPPKLLRLLAPAGFFVGLLLFLFFLRSNL